MPSSLGNIHKRRRPKGGGRGGGHKADERRRKLVPVFGKGDVVFGPPQMAESRLKYPQNVVKIDENMYLFILIYNVNIVYD